MQHDLPPSLSLDESTHSWLAWELKVPKHQERFTRIKELHIQLSDMRKMWKSADHYGRVFLERDAKVIQERIKKEITQYKKYLKSKTTDEVALEVINNLI